MTKLGQKDCIDAHTAPGSLSPNISNAVEQNMKLKKNPATQSPFNGWLCSRAARREREMRQTKQRFASLKRVSRNATSRIQWGLGRGERVLVVELHLVVIGGNRAQDSPSQPLSLIKLNPSAKLIQSRV